MHMAFSMLMCRVTSIHPFIIMRAERIPSMVFLPTTAKAMVFMVHLTVSMV